MNQERQRAGRVGPPPRRQTLSPAQAKTLARVAFRIPGVLVAIASTVVLVTLVSVNSDLTGTFGAIAGLWFAVHLVPLSIAGTSLGVFPLLPTLVLAVVVARSVARAVIESSTRRECAWVFGAAVLGPLFVTVLALAIAADASAAIGLSSPHALLAFAGVAGVHASAAAVGLVMGTWDSSAIVGRVPSWVREVVRPTVRAASVLVAGGAAIVLAAMLSSWSTMSSLLEAGNGFVGFLGLTVLSVLYLPNVVIGSVAVAVGSSAHVGDVSISQFGTVGGSVPPLPVLAVLPEGPAQPLWMLMLVVPVAAGVFLGRDCARRTTDISHALSSVWVGASVIGVATLVVGYAAGGNFGTFGTVQVTVWSLGLLTFAWLAVVGSIAATATAWHRHRSAEPLDATDADEAGTESRAHEAGTESRAVEFAPAAALTQVIDTEQADTQSAETEAADTSAETGTDTVEADTTAAPSDSFEAPVIDAEVVDGTEFADEIAASADVADNGPPVDAEVVDVAAATPTAPSATESGGTESGAPVVGEDLPDRRPGDSD